MQASRILACAAAAVVLAAQAALASPLRRADGGETPLRVYGQQDGFGPTLIVSHGFGSDETGLSAFANALAGQGWRVLVMGHRESGRQHLRQALLSGSPRQALAEGSRSPAAHRARFLDLDAAYAAATRGCRPRRLVLAGHSMGAMTTILEAGARATFGRFGGDRFDAYVAISPQGTGTAFTKDSWLGVSKPVLMITGTDDRALEGGPETRLEAFAWLPPGRKRLAVIPGAGHIALGSNRDGALSRTVAALTVEFLDGLSRPARLPPSLVAGVDVRDK